MLRRYVKSIHTVLIWTSHSQRYTDSRIISQCSLSLDKTVVKHTKELTDPNGRAVYEVGLWPLNCWDCGFEPR